MYVGMRVEIGGLNSRADLNKTIGTAESFDQKKGRYGVRPAPGEKIALKALLRDMADEGLIDSAPGRAFHKMGGVPKVTVLRVYLGTVPDYSQGEIEGVKLSGVSKVGPAGKAGVQGGDIIVELAGQPIKNIYDYTYVLGALKVGEEIVIKVKRGEEVVELKITPGSRD